MITINLLPEELRSKEVQQIHVPYQKIAFGIFSIVFLLTIYNLIVYVRVRSEYRTLQKQWTQMADKSAQADALEKELGSSITSEVDFYDTLVDPPLETAKIMNLISDLIPTSVWLDQINFSRKKKDLDLTIVGFSQSSGATSKLVEIQNFVNALKIEMEKYFAPTSQINPASKNHLKVSVTTSSKKTAEHTEIIQFTANFKTEAAEKK